MLFAIGAVDYTVLGIYLLAMLGVGAYFSRQQHTSKDFFLAGRSMGWFPVGLSVMATLLSALSYSGVPGAAYYEGMKFLLMPVAVWLTLPILWRYILPLYQGLEMFSVYEYLELRFDAATRMLSSLVFVVWRLLWLGGVLYAPCKVLVVAAGLNVPMWLLILVLGLVSTLYTFLGGMKAVIWTDVIQSIVMVGGLFFIIGGIWWSLDGGPARVWEVAEELGRTELVETNFAWSEYWSVWGLLPHFVLSMLSFYIADQITAQRFLTARDLREARRSFVLNCLSVTIMIPALAYVGLSLLAFYHDNPQTLRADWVANLDNSASVDPRRGVSYVDPQSGRPLTEWHNPRIRDDRDTVDALVAQRKLLRPNSKQPFVDPAELTDAQTGRLDVERLAMRRPTAEGSGIGEVVLHEKAQDELMPRFITDQLWQGMAGLILAALFAASMSSMDSGLNSICTLLIMDFHRRLGWGRSWLATRAGKSVGELDESDELRLGRPLVLLIGLAATGFSLLVSRVGNIFDIMVAVVNTFGGPLLAVFLLGIFTRRCTARAALLALLTGTLFTIWLMASNTYASMRWLWPFEEQLASIWPLSFGVVFTLLFGYVASLLVGRRKSPTELRGLVVGLGQLGRRQ